jgi:dihydrodipicolinate synthase/N-acetylneuraminate lyase
MEQAAILSRKKFPTAMLLPTVAVSTPEGVRTAVLKIVERLGRPIVLYIKDPGYVTLDVVKSLVEAKAISWIKYAVVRPDPAQDELLAGLVLTVDPAIIVSGIGEQPAIVHYTKFGVRAFTSGCVCVAPRRSQEMLRALQAGDLEWAEKIRERFVALEDLRNAHGPIAVLHHAVAQAGIAQTGPMLPLLANLSDEIIDEIHPAAEGLLKWNAA